jgi:hypothetical protein
MTRRPYFTVAALNARTGRYEMNRVLETKAKALKWATYLRTLGEIAETTVYEGGLGALVIERKAA